MIVGMSKLDEILGPQLVGNKFQGLRCVPPEQKIYGKCTYTTKRYDKYV